uniref:Uncharacterized protein n=1 Tax=Panagrolaimus sp. PS1159 TaxID=55785 RepID=A0AC35FAV3_9BILA
MQSDMELEDVKPSRKRISKVKGQQRPGSRSSTRLKMIDENKKTTPAKKRGRPSTKKTPPKPKTLLKNITEEAADDDDYEIDGESNKEDEEEDEYEALEEDEEEDEKMLSDVELEDRISVAKGQLPGSHSRLKMIGENKRFKFRASACTNSKVTPFNVQEYLVSARNARDMFFDIMSEEGCIEELLNANEVTFTPSVPDSENLTKWLERSSVKFAFRTDFSPKKKHTLSIQDSPPP